MLGHAAAHLEGPPGHRRLVRRPPDPGRGGRPVRVDRAWVYKLKARYEAEGDTALEPRSRRPKTSPTALDPAVVDLIVRLRKELAGAGLDAAPNHRLAPAPPPRPPGLPGHLLDPPPDPPGPGHPRTEERLKAPIFRFEAALPNETWQSDFTHYRLTTGADVEIISSLDDDTRYALHVTAHHRVTGPIVTTTFKQALAQHGIPASTLTDNGMGLDRPPGRRPRRPQHLRTRTQAPAHRPEELPDPHHHLRKVETVPTDDEEVAAQQQPNQPASLASFQALLESFVDEYNHRRPHKLLPHRSTPAARNT